jgi:hypothetical protein
MLSKSPVPPGQAGPDANNDWTFRREPSDRGSAGIPPAAAMPFHPGGVVIRRGTRMTWYNCGEVRRQIFIPELSANSEIMSRGARCSMVFKNTGAFEVRGGGRDYDRSYGHFWTH